MRASAATHLPAAIDTRDTRYRRYTRQMLSFMLSRIKFVGLFLGNKRVVPCS